MLRVVGSVVLFGLALLFGMRLFGDASAVEGTAPGAVADPTPFVDTAGAALSGISRHGETVFFRRSTGATQLFSTGRDGSGTRQWTRRGHGIGFAVPSPEGTRVVEGY